MSNREFMKADELTRRRFMTNAARAYLGVTVAPLLGASIAGTSLGQTAKGGSGPGKLAEHVVFLNMSGGMSHLDTFDVKPRNKEVQGPVEAIATSGDFQLSQYLPKSAEVANHMCLINSMSSKQGAHEQGQYLLQQ